VVALRAANEFGELELPVLSESEQRLMQAERERLHGNSGFNGGVGESECIMKKRLIKNGSQVLQRATIAFTFHGDKVLILLQI